MARNTGKPIRIKAADLVQQAILSGRLSPGSEIPQLKLARSMGLSQASVREALQELEHRGLIVPHGRTRTIIDLSEDDLYQMCQVRMLLEPVACRLAAENWTPTFCECLESNLAAMQAAAHAGNWREILRVDLEFHRAIWRHQSNRYLEKHLNILCVPLFAYALVRRKDSGVPENYRLVAQHRTIVNMLRTRDGPRVERLLRRIIERDNRQDLAEYRRLRETELPGPRPEPWVVDDCVFSGGR